MDKNMILMIKDIAIDRFMTLNTLNGSYSSIFQSMVIIFYEGDKLLCSEGNLSYDAIKLLEPSNVHIWNCGSLSK